jgi:hypothetical protein
MRFNWFGLAAGSGRQGPAAGSGWRDRLRWRGRPRVGIRYEREWYARQSPSYAKMQAARRARVRRGLWWTTLGVGIIVVLCCSGIVVSQISFGGSARPVGVAAVPDVVGKRLPDARKLLSTAGFGNAHAVDATGQGRLIFSTVTWVVQSTKPPAGTRVDRSSQVVLEVKKSTDGQGTLKAVPGEMPRVVCKDLQSAEDIIHDAGFVNVSSRDGSGSNRSRLFDRDWVVIAQSVPAGTHPDSSTRILLTAVKYGEPTGNSGCLS